MYIDNLAEFKHRWKKLNLADSALIVIDMQRYFLDEDSHACVPEGKIITKNIGTLVEKYRGHDRPVIFTNFAVCKGEDDPIINWWNDTVEEGSRDSEIVEELKPRENELVIRKPTYDAFYKTELEEYLRERDIKQVVITGVLTNLCCETTAREAFVRGFDVFVVIDGMASYSEEMHVSSLKNLAYGFATPISTNDL